MANNDIINPQSKNNPSNIAREVQVDYKRGNIWVRNQTGTTIDFGSAIKIDFQGGNLIMANGEITATARIPCRPLSYENRDMAVAKELLVDYKNGNVWVCKEDGSFIDLGNSIKEIIKEDQTISQNITINIEGVNYTLETIVTDNTNNIEQIFNALGYYKTPEGKVGFNVIDKIATIDPSSGDVTFIIKSSDITETTERQFVSETDKQKWNKSTHPEIIKTQIQSGDLAWNKVNDKYEQRIDIAEVRETDIPVVDICLSDTYAAVQKELDSYSHIYKVVAHNGHIMVYSNEITANNITVQLKLDR